MVFGKSRVEGGDFFPQQLQIMNTFLKQTIMLRRLNFLSYPEQVNHLFQRDI